MKSKSPFLESIRQVMRLRGYSLQTEKSYLFWIYRFIRFHENKHPRNMTIKEVNQFLEYLASDHTLNSKSQKVALSAISFLYNKFLEQPLPKLDRASQNKARRPPIVLSVSETISVIKQLNGTHRTVVELIYSSGLRISECLRLRVRDLNFHKNSITVRNSDGHIDRTTILSKKLALKLQVHMRQSMAIQKNDARENVSPSIPIDSVRSNIKGQKTTGWMFLFPSSNVCHAANIGSLNRHHIHASVIQKSVRCAALTAGYKQRITCQTFRHSCAVHLLEYGTGITTVQQLLGHKNIATTKIYNELMCSKTNDPVSPFDRIFEK